MYIDLSKMQDFFSNMNYKYQVWPPENYRTDPNTLEFLMHENELLKKYIKKPTYSINKFLIMYPILKDGKTMEEKVKESEKAIKKYKRVINHEFQPSLVLQNYDFYTSSIYLPCITPRYIQELINLDELFRLSKYASKYDFDVYRGTVDPMHASLMQLNSFSFSKATADCPNFSRGAVFCAHICKGFPYLNLTPMSEYNEKEVLLPPCEFETRHTVGKHRNFNNDGDVYVMNINIRPLSLAKVFLERMKNPPEDYPKYYLYYKKFEYEKAMQMLEDYVKNYVDKHIIEVNGEIIPELPDPEIIFDSEQYEKNN